MRRGLLRVGLVCGLLLSGATTAHAQGPPATLSDVLHRFGLDIDEDFADGLNASLRQQVATYPVATSSGGFTYSFDTALGIAGRSTRSFGPFFTDRALTLGRRRVSVSLNSEHALFNRFEGQDLTNLVLVGNPEYQSVLQLRVVSDTSAWVAEFGVLSRLDVAIVAPIVHVSMDATVASGETGEVVTHQHEHAAASGLGDLIVRAKYNFRPVQRSAVSTAVDVTVPTGDVLNMTGIGYSRTKLYLVASAESGMWSPHFNFGVLMPTRSLGTNIAFPFTKARLGINEIDSAGGIDFIPSPVLTISSDALVRVRRNQGVYGYLDDPDSPGYRYFSLRNSVNDTRTQMFGSIGAKLNVHGTLLATASTLFPLNSTGLASRLAFVLGFDYGF